MADEPTGRSRTAALLTGVGIGFASFIVIAILSTAKPVQWIVPLAILGAAFYFRTRATQGLWGFDRFRTANIGWWTGGFAVLFALAGSAPPPPSGNANGGTQTVSKEDDATSQAQEEAAARRERMRDDPEEFVELENINWSQNFSVMKLSVTIKNNSEFDLKDFVIDCEHSGPSGTVMDSNRREIFEIVEAGKERRIRDFNMGFINSQATTTACIVTRARLVE